MILRFLLTFVLASGAAFAQLVTITGTFKNPDSTAVNGTVRIELERNASNSCSTPAQVIAFRQVTVKIINGSLGTLSLYPTSCLTPTQYYVVYVYDQNNKQLYRGIWNVPTGSSADVTQISYVQH